MIASPLTLDQALAAARETRRLVIGSNVLDQTPALFAEMFPQRETIVVADVNTFAAAGGRVQDAFRTSGIAIRRPFIIDDPQLYAESRFVDSVESALHENEAVPVAVGSGTINDLTKLAAHRCGRQYLCVATAASMDGYTAFGASITHEGSKQTFDCPAPAAVLADLEVIRAAPAAMQGWGYADLSAKITAGADWIIADALGMEPIDTQAWNIVQGRLHAALSDSKAVAPLVEGLMLGGFAMQATRSSRPASGAEHQFSHLWDMQHHVHHGVAPSHGAKVGIGTLAITALYESLLAMPIDQLDVERCVAAWPDKAAWQRLAEEQFDVDELKNVAKREIAAKHCSGQELSAQLQLLAEIWPKLRDDLQRQIVPYAQLKQMLQAAGAPTEPEQIGISH
ncbi:MAG TPA: sn-glycerol-1-phosphate dehydrogenase, partial [Pirellulales bacterium]|nr:sn-glycerol-1-phosphate dehydrogenase [Pirellulales bacterium]